MDLKRRILSIIIVSDLERELEMSGSAVVAVPRRSYVDGWMSVVARW